jgi:hypothetical protein
MTSAVEASRAADEPTLVTKLDELSPSPEGEILAIASTEELELFRRTPVVVLPKLTLIGGIAAGAKKRTDLLDGGALVLKRLREEPSERNVRLRETMASSNAGDRLTFDVIDRRVNLDEHDRSSLTRGHDSRRPVALHDRQLGILAFFRA